MKAHSTVEGGSAETGTDRECRDAYKYTVYCIVSGQQFQNMGVECRILYNTCKVRYNSTSKGTIIKPKFRRFDDTVVTKNTHTIILAGFITAFSLSTSLVCIKLNGCYGAQLPNTALSAVA
jgi:hypothetical protein